MYILLLAGWSILPKAVYTFLIPSSSLVLGLLPLSPKSNLYLSHLRRNEDFEFLNSFFKALKNVAELWKGAKEDHKLEEVLISLIAGTF